MKKLTCSDLGGPSDCQAEIEGETFEELGNKCKAHVMEQMSQKEESHLAAVEKMKNASPEDQQKMFAEYQQKFDAAPEA